MVEYFYRQEAARPMLLGFALAFSDLCFPTWDAVSKAPSQEATKHQNHRLLEVDYKALKSAQFLLG